MKSLLVSFTFISQPPFLRREGLVRTEKQDTLAH